MNATQRFTDSQARGNIGVQHLIACREEEENWGKCGRHEEEKRGRACQCSMRRHTNTETDPSRSAQT